MIRHVGIERGTESVSERMGVWSTSGGATIRLRSTDIAWNRGRLLGEFVNLLTSPTHMWLRRNFREDYG